MWRTHPPPDISFNGLAVTTHWSWPQAPGCTDHRVDNFPETGGQRPRRPAGKVQEVPLVLIQGDFLFERSIRSGFPALQISRASHRLQDGDQPMAQQLRSGVSNEKRGSKYLFNRTQGSVHSGSGNPTGAQPPAGNIPTLSSSHWND